MLRQGFLEAVLLHFTCSKHAAVQNRGWQAEMPSATALHTCLSSFKGSTLSREAIPSLCSLTTVSQQPTDQHFAFPHINCLITANCAFNEHITLNRNLNSMKLGY